MKRQEAESILTDVLNALHQVFNESETEEFKNLKNFPESLQTAITLTENALDEVRTPDKIDPIEVSSEIIEDCYKKVSSIYELDWYAISKTQGIDPGIKDCLFNAGRYLSKTSSYLENTW